MYDPQQGAIEDHKVDDGTPACIGQWCCGCDVYPAGKPWGWNFDRWEQHMIKHHLPGPPGAIPDVTRDADQHRPTHEHVEAPVAETVSTDIGRTYAVEKADGWHIATWDGTCHQVTSDRQSGDRRPAAPHQVDRAVQLPASPHDARRP